MTKTKLLIASAALLASTVLPSAAFACYCQASSPSLGQLRLLFDGNADRAPSVRHT